MSEWQTAGDADPEWAVEARIDGDLVRVRRGERTRWLVLDGPLPGNSSVTVCEAEEPAWPHTAMIRVEGRPGLLIPRYDGGLLDDALRMRGGMTAPLALGVLDEVLALLETAPPAPGGASRTTVRAFAVDGGGDIALLPGRFRDAAARTDSAELGELLHLALTGRTWEETGLPLQSSAPEVPAEVVDLFTDLCETGEGELEGVSLRRRIARMGPSRERGFLPAEPGVTVDATPTGTLGADVVSALRGAPRLARAVSEGSAAVDDVAPMRTGRRARSASKPRLVRSASERPRRRTGSRERDRGRGRRRGRPARARTGRMSAAALSIVMLCCAGVVVGVGLMVRGAAGDALQAQPRTPASAGQDPEAAHLKNDDTGIPDAGAPASGTPDPEGPGTGTHSPDDPLAAVVELSRLRAEAVASGDAGELARLTVPRSPAAAADSALALEGCEGCADTSLALEVSDVRRATAAERPPASAVEPSAADGTGPPADGAREYVRATMRTAGAGSEQVLFVLERHGGEWRVHSVHAA